MALQPYPVQSPKYWPVDLRNSSADMDSSASIHPLCQSHSEVLRELRLEDRGGQQRWLQEARSRFKFAEEILSLK